MAPSPELVRRQLRAPSVAEMVASQLRERIVDGTLCDGDELPKLEDLIVEFGVSKPSLREALRILESEGLLTVRRGKVGGATVHAPRAQNAAYMLGLVLRTDQVSLSDIGVALQRLEPACASLCAERADRETSVIPALEQLQAQLEAGIGLNDDEFVELAGRFHSALVEHCGNATLILVVGALESIWMAQAAALVRDKGGSRPTTSDRRRAVSVHAKILERIRRGDARGAYDFAHRHLVHAQAVPLAGEDVPIRLTELHGAPTR